MKATQETRSRGMRDVEILEPYSEEQLLDLSNELVELSLERREKREALKKIQKKYRDEIAELDDDIDTHVDQIDKGGITKTVSADLVLNFSDGVREYWIGNNLVKTDDLQDTDYQTDLEDAVQENKKREAEAEVSVSADEPAAELEGEATGDLPFEDDPEEAPESPQDARSPETPESADEPENAQEGENEAVQAPKWTKAAAGIYCMEAPSGHVLFEAHKTARGWELLENVGATPPVVAVLDALKDCKLFAGLLVDGEPIEYAARKVKGAGGKVLSIGPLEEAPEAPPIEKADPFARYDHFRVEIDHEGEGTYAYQENGKQAWASLTFGESLLSWSDAEVQEWTLSNYGKGAADVLEISRL